MNELLNELYQIDGSLRKNEADLKKIIERLVISRPYSTLNKEFQTNLRKELQLHAKDIPIMKKKPTTQQVETRSFSFRPFAFATGGLVIGLIAAFAVFKAPVYYTSITEDKAALPSYLSLQIDRVSENAFGTIATQEGEMMGVPEAVGAGGGGGLRMDSQAMATDEAISAVAPGVATSEMMRILPPEYAKSYEYVYTGEDFSVEESQMDVLKQKAGTFSSGSLNSVVQSLNLGVVDLSTFRNMEVQDISMVQDEEFGYIINVSTRRGSVSINQNWERWKSIQPTCQDQACWDAYQLTPADVPSNEKLIEIANAFLAEHNIDLSSYGDPQIDRSWETTAMPERSSIRVPDVQQVIYPLEINGKRSYDSAGNPSGLWVGVNVRANRVSHVNNIRTLHFEASSYETMRDVDTILDQAKRGGLYSQQFAGAQETIRVEIGTPVVAFVQVHNNIEGRAQELHVPALVFPIIGGMDPSKGIWRRNIVVPIVKGVIPNIDRPVPMPLPEPIPMPMLEAEVTEVINLEVR